MTEDELAELVLRHLRAMYAQLRTPIATGLLTRQLLRVTPRERFTAHRVGRVLTALEAQGLVVNVPDSGGARRWRPRSTA